jgi:adenylate cyclase
VGRAGDAHDPALLAAFAEALAAFQAQHWSAAAARLEALLAEHPGDGPARFYLDRCRRYLAGAAPPPDPGVIHLERK